MSAVRRGGEVIPQCGRGGVGTLRVDVRWEGGGSKQKGRGGPKTTSNVPARSFNA